MKYRFAVFGVMLLSSISLFAQINVGLLEGGRLNRGAIYKEDVEEMKKRTAYFVCRDDDDVQAMQSAFEAVWTISPIKVIPFSQRDSIDLEKATIFMISGFSKTVQYVDQNGSSAGHINWTNTHMYLKFTLPEVKERRGKKKIEMKWFGRIEIYPMTPAIPELKPDQSYDEFLYTDGAVYNWNPTFLSFYLKVFNQQLVDVKKRWLYSSTVDKVRIKQLRKDTLYIPDYVFNNNAAVKNEGEERLDMKKILKEYHYPYVVLTSEEIAERMKSSPAGLLVMSLIISSTDQYLTVFDTKDGAMIYSKYAGLSYNLKPGNVAKLNKIIRKAK